MSSKPHNFEMTEEQKREAEAVKKELNRLEKEAPRYDVEYYVELPKSRAGPLKDSDGQMVMEAHGMLNDDLGQAGRVPLNTTVSNDPMPGTENTFSVMITVAAEVKQKVFENAEAAYLVDPGNKHYLWCVKDHECPDDLQLIESVDMEDHYRTAQELDDVFYR